MWTWECVIFKGALVHDSEAKFIRDHPVWPEKLICGWNISVKLQKRITNLIKTEVSLKNRASKTENWKITYFVCIVSSCHLLQCPWAWTWICLSVLSCIQVLHQLVEVYSVQRSFRRWERGFVSWILETSLTILTRTPAYPWLIWKHHLITSPFIKELISRDNKNDNFDHLKIYILPVDLSPVV